MKTESLYVGGECWFVIDVDPSFGVAGRGASIPEARAEAQEILRVWRPEIDYEP